MFSLTFIILMISSPAPWTSPTWTQLGTVFSAEAWIEILVLGGCISFTFRMLRLTIKIKTVATRRIPGDGFPQKNGTDWSDHVVVLDRFAIHVAAKTLASRILSFMLLPLSSAEEKTCVGGDGFPEKNGTGWSGRIVELDPVTVAAAFSARQVSLMMLPFSSAEVKTGTDDDGLPEKNGTGWSGHVVELDPVAIAMESLPGRSLFLMLLALSSAEVKT
jgi:hypothetical protein